jgi:hypothetical protein
LYNTWYDLETLQQVPSTSSATALTAVPAPLHKIPVFIRPGSIIPRKLRLRRSSKLMRYDPYTLVVAPLTVGPGRGTAQGKLYLDDEHSLAHEVTGAYAYRAFTFADNVLTCAAAAPLSSTSSASAAAPSSTAVSATGGARSTGYDAPNTVERIVLAGQTRSPKKVILILSSLSVVILGEVVYDHLVNLIISVFSLSFLLYHRSPSCPPTRASLSCFSTSTLLLRPSLSRNPTPEWWMPGLSSSHSKVNRVVSIFWCFVVFALYIVCNFKQSEQPNLKYI